MASNIFSGHLIYLWFCCFVLEIDWNPKKSTQKFRETLEHCEIEIGNSAQNIEKFLFFYQFIYTKKGGFIYYIESPVNAMINGLFYFFIPILFPRILYSLPNSLIFFWYFAFFMFSIFVIKEFQNIFSSWILFRSALMIPEIVCSDNL